MKTIFLILLLPVLVFSQGIKDKHKSVIARKNVAGGEPPAYNADAVVYFDTLESKSLTLDATHKTAYSNFFANLIDTLGMTNIYDRIDMLLLLGNQDTLAALTNAVYPTEVATRKIGMTFVVDTGFTSGNNLYINTLYNTSTDGIALTLDDASVTVYNWTNATETTGYDFGSNDETNRIVMAIANTTYFDGKTGWGVFTASIDYTDSILYKADGTFTMTRRADDDSELYHEGASKQTKTTASSTLINLNVWLGEARYPVLESGVGTTRQYFLFMIHDGVTDNEALYIYNCIEALKTDLGL